MSAWLSYAPAARNNKEIDTYSIDIFISTPETKGSTCVDVAVKAKRKELNP